MIIMKLKYLFFAFLLICIDSLYGQAYQELKNLTIKDGLPSNVVYAIKQDSKGFIWATTNKGVVKYDGRKFKLYTVKDGLPSNDNFSMLLDSKDNVWLYSFKAVCKIGNDGVIKTYVETNSNFSYFMINDYDEIFFRINKINNLDLDNKSEYTYYKIQKDNIITLDISIKPNFHETYSVFLFNDTFAISSYSKEDQKNIGVVLRKNKFEKLDLNSNTFPTLTITHKFSLISEFLVVNDSISILMNSYNYKIYNCNQSRLEKTFPIEIRKFTNGNSYHYNGSLLVLLDNGIYKLDVESDTNGVFVPFLDIPKATGVLYDNDGSFWVSTLGEGIYKAPRKSAYAERKIVEILNGNRIVKLSGYKNIKLWYVNSSNEISELFSKQKYPNKGLIDFRFIENDGLKIFYGGSNAFYVDNRLFSSYGFKSLSIRKDSMLSSTTFGMNFFSKINPEIPIYQNKFQSVDLQGRMFAVLLLNDLFYCGNENGLFYGRRNIKELIPICLSENEASISINGLAESSDGLIWVATEGYGVFILKDNIPIKHFTNELLDLNIHSMRLDNLNNIWLSTRLGVNKIEKSGSGYVVSSLTAYHGLPSNYINDTYCYDNLLYVATDAGLVSVNLDDINHNEFRIGPPAYIFGGSVIDKKMWTKLNLNTFGTFDSQQNSFNFEYTGISHRSNGKIGFEYRLLPTISNWTYTSNDNITFNALSPHRYTFEVRAINAIGIRSAEPAKYSFEICKHFTQATWFILLVAALLIGLSVLIVSTYFRIKRRRYEETNKTQRIISELKLKSLQSQLNPHFIFNSLNAIQQFINVENRRSANDYLARFARLMRLYLGGSENQFISLEQEMEVIKLYCQLEHLRFADKYQYEIKVEVGLDLSQIMVPAMLLQPHVENAIRHGLVPSGNNNNNFLMIDVYKSDGGVMCIIRDNGIGRAKSLELKMFKQEMHRSLGNKISKERLEVIRELKLANIIETIDDIICEDKVCGTEVKIFIGFKKSP